MTAQLRILPAHNATRPAPSVLLGFALLFAFLASGCGDESTTGPAEPSTGNPNEVLFASSRDTVAAEVFAFPTDGQHTWTRLTNNWARNYDPKWSPDGTRIAFLSEAFGGVTEICIANADGTDFTRLTSTPEQERGPTWIPTTGEIAFSGPPSEIHAVSPGDQSIRAILAGLPVREPAWSLDGTHLAFSSPGGAIFVGASDGTGAAMVTDTLAGYFLSPAWSPDGQKIACIQIPVNGTPGVFVMNADGSNLTRLTTNNMDFDPCWSPDGGRIAFQRPVGGAGQIHIMDADGSNVMQLTSGTGWKSHPDWSPDGQLIAYDCTFDHPIEPGKSVWIVDADGSNPRPLIPGRAADMQPAWSSGSRELAFASNRYGDFEIFVRGADQEERRVTSSPGADVEPTWSYSGTSIAFTSNRDGNEEIYSISPSGGDVTRLTNEPGRDYSPSWSATDDIAFVSERDGNSEIYLMAANGSLLRRRTLNAASDISPAWSPDGGRIAFASDRGGNLDIYVMNADGTGVTQLTSDPAEDRDPAWSSDGRQIAFLSMRFGTPFVYRMNADGSGQIRFVGGDDPAWGEQAPPPAAGGNPLAATR